MNANGECKTAAGDSGYTATETAASPGLFDLRQNALHLFAAEGTHGLALDVAE